MWEAVLARRLVHSYLPLMHKASHMLVSSQIWTGRFWESMCWVASLNFSL